MLTQLVLTPHQQAAHDLILDFTKSQDSVRNKLFTIGGYAGTGKTTMISSVVESIRKDNSNYSIAFCTYTGKAALVLKNKLNGTLALQDYCGTIHGLMYQLIATSMEHGKKKLHWERVPDIDYNLIVIDEASMVDGEIFRDLQRYGIPILAIGDHGQLPPVNGKFNLMEHPDYRLEKIMRQAENNPIIKLATMARHDGYIPCGVYGEGVEKTNDSMVVNELNWPAVDITLCGTNKTRIYMNSFIRGKLGFTGKNPEPGEEIICLKNNREAGIFNGNIGTLRSIKEAGRLYEITADMNGDVFTGLVPKDQFGNTELVEGWFDNFDWANCITTHKAQGGEWDSVVLIEERMRFMDDENWRKWLYTALTRAREKLLIIGRDQ